MALFNYGVGSLEDVLRQGASTGQQAITQDFAKKRRRLTAQQAASGRLGSNVAEYSFGDLDNQEASALAGNQAGLESALAGVPAEDFLSSQEYDRKLRLAKLIGSQNKPSTLEEVLGGVSAAVGPAAAFASFI